MNIGGRHFSTAEPPVEVWKQLCKLLLAIIPLSILGLLVFGLMTILFWFA